jgi:hypothetical protein
VPDRKALDRAVYDHEIEAPHEHGERRRRRVDDWGVGEELFDRMPSRRSGRPSPRRDAHAARRFAPAEEAPRRFARDETGAEPRRFSHDEAAPEAVSPRRFAPGGPDGEAHSAPPVSPDAPTAELGAAIPSVPAPVPGETPRVDVAGRRTVVITGRPGPLGQIPARRRPPRTATERIGARPDRIVAWAVALGILLILIAVATANAAVAPALLLPVAVSRRGRVLPPAAASAAAETPCGATPDG